LQSEKIFARIQSEIYFLTLMNLLHCLTKSRQLLCSEEVNACPVHILDTEEVYKYCNTKIQFY